MSSKKEHYLKDIFTWIGYILAGLIILATIVGGCWALKGWIFGFEKIRTEKLVADEIVADTITADVVEADEVITDTVDANVVTANTGNFNVVNAGTVNANTVNAGTINTEKVNIVPPTVIPTVPHFTPATPAPTAIATVIPTDYGNTPQEYIPHPNMYKETGVSGQPFTWTFEVKSDEMAVVGGYNVNGQAGGNYIGYGPGTHSVTVIDGFISVVNSQWGKAEFDFRVNQAEKFGWAHANLNPGPIK